MLSILLILIFIRPFISSLAFPFVNSTYHILLLGFFLIWIVRKKISLGKIKPVRNQLALFILAILISWVVSNDKTNSIKELCKYAAGLSLLLISISLLPRDKNRVILCMTISGLLISFLAIYQYFFGFRHLLDYISKQGITDSFALDIISRKRVFFPFVTPNTLAGYLIMILPLALIFKNRAWFIVPVAFAILLTKSLGAFLSIFLVLMMCFYLQGRLQKRKIIILSGLLLIIILVFISRMASNEQHIQPIFSTTMRLGYWEETLRMIKAHPFVGVGLGNFNFTKSRFAHNSYLQLWAEMGILGIISFLWLIITVMRLALIKISNSAQKNQTIYLLSAYTAFLLHNFVDFTFFLPEVTMTWWVILGLIASQDQLS